MKLQIASLKVDLEEQLTRSGCSFETYQIPESAEVYLADANKTPYGKENLRWSILKCMDKLPQHYGLSYSALCR